MSAHQLATRTLGSVLEAELERQPVASAIGVDIAWPLAALPARLVELTTDETGTLVLDPALRVDLALIADRGSHDTGHAFEENLARLRDLHARRIIAAILIGETGLDARTTRMRALGLDALERADHDGVPLAVFRFDTSCYKPTPSWLNAEDWANPEMWNRRRW